MKNKRIYLSNHAISVGSPITISYQSNIDLLNTKIPKRDFKKIFIMTKLDTGQKRTFLGNNVNRDLNLDRRLNTGGSIA